MATTIGQLAPWLIPSRMPAQALAEGAMAGAAIGRNRLEAQRMGFAAEQANAELDLQSARQRMLEQAQTFKHQAELGELETGKQNQQLLGDLLTKWNATTDLSTRLNFLSEPKYGPLLLDKRFQPIIGDLTEAAKKQYDIQQGTAEAAAITSQKAFATRLMNEYKMPPGTKFGSPEWQYAATQSAQDDAASIASELGVQNAPQMQIPQLANGQLNANRWKMMMEPFRPKAPSGSKPSGFRTDAKGNIVSQTFEEPDAPKPEKGKTEREWVEMRVPKLLEEKDEITGKPLLTAPQATEKARQEYRAMQGESPQKSPEDTAMQAERLAKSQDIPFAKTFDEAKALKPGTRFVGPDGKIRIRK